ncbi:MAG: Heteropolysaccharide repeat unit export protein [Candidatus Moranbacteria bacterium GW2011_GWE1_49_15]|nr:MAG: Heteropolysaccharide repeat unit export protein [Candidatus Moranbacteria bacterium GW2011_GWE2_47_10]KKW07345.1 MAG: Heteropolysaccharide repeat unit export protein [Candidatus Moranbacteria bacterium GW2011_GWE1_49_15]HBP00828.1 hypothetical protein [Candidatus Moranbacteria bacterium]
MAIARKIAYNVIFNAAAKVVSTVLALIGIGFVTRYLGKEGFGNYSVVIAFFSFFGAIADLGLYAIATRNISREGADEEKIIGNVLALRMTTAVSIFVLSPLLAYFLPYSNEVKLGIVLSAGAFVFASTYGVLNGVFQKNLAMDKVSLVELLGKAIQVGAIVIAVKKDWGFNAIIISMLVAMAFNFSLIFLLARRYIRIRLRFDFSYWKMFLKESFPMGISVIVTFLYFKLDTILLSILQDSSQVGIYNAAYKVIENFTFFPAMIIGLVLPLMSRNIFSDKARFEYISNETIKVFLILAIPLVIGTLFLSDQIIGLIAGQGFSEAAGTLRILIFALAFIFFGHFFNNILIAGNMQKKLMLVLSASAAFNIVANLLLIPIFSYTGAAVVSVFTEFLVVVLTFNLTKKYLGFKPRVKNVWGILGSGAVMAIFLLSFSGLNMFVLALGAALVYGAALFATKTVSIGELASIVSVKQKAV